MYKYVCVKAVGVNLLRVTRGCHILIELLVCHVSHSTLARFLLRTLCLVLLLLQRGLRVLLISRCDFISLSHHFSFHFQHFLPILPSSLHNLPNISILMMRFIVIVTFSGTRPHAVAKVWRKK